MKKLIDILKEDVFDSLEIGDDSVTYNPKLKREIDLMIQSGKALLKYEAGDYGPYGEYEAWESLKEDLIELHQQSSLKNPEAFADFVDRNENNDSHTHSSNSFFNALIDFDGLMSAWDELFKLTDEEWDIASDYYNKERKKIIQKYR
jgi:hypothetical protein